MKLQSKLMALYVIFVALYSLLLLVAPPPRVALARYHLSVNELHLLYLTIIIPLAIIWFLAFYGYAKLQAYSKIIKRTKDGDQVAWVASGLMVLAIGLPINSLLGSITNLLAQTQPSLFPASTILRNYASVFLPLAGFLLICRGASGLNELVKRRPSQLISYTLTAIVLLVGVMYCFITLRYSHGNTYHMPDWVTMLTIVAPYLFTWYVGLVAVYQIHLYSRHIDGIVYRKSWDKLAAGLGSILVMSIVFQYITTITRQLAIASLGWTLLIVYGLLALLSVGYVLVAQGAKKLQKIEEV